MTDALTVPVQADNDEAVLASWLDGLSTMTQRAYGADARSFLTFVGKPLRSVTVPDVQAFGATLDGLAPASKARKLSSVKSLLSFAQRLGYVAFNAGAPVRLPKLKNALAERIMTEGDILLMIRMETNPRNHALLRLMYGAGLRVSEACGLTWRDLTAREVGGQVTVHGKGERTRFVALPDGLWSELTALRGAAGPDDAVFVSREGGKLDPASAHRVVKAAAKRAGLPDSVSCHWLRHACASHALDRKAPVHVVQQTLGHSSLATTSKYVHARPTDSAAMYLAV